MPEAKIIVVLCRDSIAHYWSSVYDQSDPLRYAMRYSGQWGTTAIVFNEATAEIVAVYRDGELVRQAVAHSNGD